MQTHTIRQASATDIPAIQRIYAYGDAYHRAVAPWFFREHEGPARSEEYLLQSLTGDQAAIFLADDPAGEAVGLVHLFERTAPELPFLTPRRYAVIEALIVLPEVQRHGIGAALLRQAEAWALERGIGQIELGVWEFNATAQRLYERMGYATVRRTLHKQLAGSDGETDG
jgi:GNAT superfamily N-acetyltransferase